MKIYSFTFALLLALTISSCNKSSHNHDETAAIELNDGQKWKVNAEMTPFILEGEKILTEFNSDDYEMLASQLKEQNSSLIKSCTMDGKSHDELHKWLHPHLGLVKSLGKSESNKESKKIVDQLTASFKTFHTYFE